MKLPHDLSEVPEGKLTVSMLDDNFDALQEFGSTIEERLAGAARTLDDLSKKLLALEKAFHANQGPTYAKPRKKKT